MQPITVKENSRAGWRDYAEKVGFVPDPMLLRAGEIFLNGVSGAQGLGRPEQQVAAALNDNIGGITDFFDLVVTRDVIPLIHYGDTFDAATVARSLPGLLGDRIRDVTVDYKPYQDIKAGAIGSLACLDFDRLAPLANQLYELDALRYDWQPSLDTGGPESAALHAKLAGAGEPLHLVAHFLLGGFIFGGFAQASGTTHYVQPKRSRMLLGLTALRSIGGLGHGDEDAIFAQAEADFRGGDAEVKWQKAIPPVLPYLIEQGPQPRSVMELLERALKFRETGEGKRYRAAVDAIRGDGIAARRMEDLSAVERDKALAFLEPYSKLDAQRSGALEVTLKAAAPGGVLSAETSVKLGPSRWMRIWWNDHLGFGTVRKTLRRMWMADQSYRDFSGKLLGIWGRS